MSSEPYSPLHLPPISAAANAPLYAQIVEGVRREIADGRLPAGTPLPSFRALAEQLRVSLITVKRAYDDLEHAGLIYRKQGLGTFVAEDAPQRGQDARQQEALERLREAIHIALSAGVEPAELLELFKDLANADVSAALAQMRRSAAR